MALRKLSSGLVERENFFTSSYAADFLGNNKIHFQNNRLILEEGVIERKFQRNEFLIEIEEAYMPLNLRGRASFFVRDSKGGKYGITEEYSSPEDVHHYWRLTAYDGYVQAYKSLDGKIWENIGGDNFEGEILQQGFEVRGENAFKLSSYKVYSSPYFKIYNYPEEYRAVLFEGETQVSESYFDEKGCAQIFMDYCFEGVIKIYDEENELIVESDLIPLHYGDEYLCSDYDLDLIYKSKVLDYKTTKFFINKDIMTLRNNGDEVYENLILVVNKPESNSDNISLSLDNAFFSDYITINALGANESIDFWVLHERGNGKARYGEFTIEIV